MKFPLESLFSKLSSTLRLNLTYLCTRGAQHTVGAYWMFEMNEKGDVPTPHIQWQEAAVKW